MGSYKKAKRGDPFDFPAALQNELIDLLGNGQTGLGLSNVNGSSPQGVVVTVKNVSGSARARWENMSLGPLRFAIGTDGKESVIFDGEAGHPDKPAAILQEPIDNNKFGRALIFGYTLARVAAGSPAILAAKPNGSHKLAVNVGGSVRLLASPSATVETVIPCILGFGNVGITDLRLSGNNLQYFMNGTWVTWTTGTTC